MGSGGATVAGGLSASAQLAIASGAAIAAGSAIFNQAKNALEDFKKDQEEADRKRREGCKETVGTPDGPPPEMPDPGPPDDNKLKAALVAARIAQAIKNLADAIGGF